METFEDLFEAGLRDIYYAEKALTKALPKMAKGASSKTLQSAFEAHLEETEAQVARLEKVFSMLGKQPRSKKCPAIDGLIEEGGELIKETEQGHVRDAGLVAAAQAVEHYEIARYGTLHAWAETLGHTEVATLLEQSLDEEEAADDKLSELAESEINNAAMGDAEDEAEAGPDEKIPASKSQPRQVRAVK